MKPPITSIFHESFGPLETLLRKCEGMIAMAIASAEDSGPVFADSIIVFVQADEESAWILAYARDSFLRSEQATILPAHIRAKLRDERPPPEQWDLVIFAQAGFGAGRIERKVFPGGEGKVLFGSPGGAA